MGDQVLWLWGMDVNVQMHMMNTAWDSPGDKREEAV